MTERRRSLFVTPFYLQMMRFNSVQQSSDVLTGIKEVGQEASAADVVALLRDHWRERVMGAWFALLFDDKQVTESVLQGFARRLGTAHASKLLRSSLRSTNSKDTSIKGMMKSGWIPVKRAYAHPDWASDESLKVFIRAQPWDTSEGGAEPEMLHLVITNRSLFLVPDEGPIEHLPLKRISEVTGVQHGEIYLMNIILDTGDAKVFSTKPQAVRVTRSQVRKLK